MSTPKKELAAVRKGYRIVIGARTTGYRVDLALGDNASLRNDLSLLRVGLAEASRLLSLCGMSGKEARAVIRDIQAVVTILITLNMILAATKALKPTTYIGAGLRLAGAVSRLSSLT